MRFGNPALPSLVFAGLGTLLACGGSMASAQKSGGFELHANSNITASDVGLPAYPGSKLFKGTDSDPAVDMGFTLGDTHFRLVAANYLSDDSPEKILDFYRKPLAHFGDVLECDHGKPVGAIKETRSGLTCSDKQEGHVQVEGNVDSSSDHELRAGSPQKFHLVGIGERQGTATHFGLVYIETPKDTSKAKAD
jgi:hypothetical protein